MRQYISQLQQNTITREHLARAIKRNTGININKAAQLIEQVIGCMSSALRNSNQVKIRLFGNFSVRKKNVRIGRNPKTMVEVQIPERKIIKFKVAPTLKKKINDNIENIKLLAK